MRSKHLALLANLVIAAPFPARAQDSLSPSNSGLDALLNTKVSTAAKYSQTMIEAASAVSIITSEDIKQYGYRTLDEALASVNGFYLTYDRGYTYLGTRGFSRPTDYNNRVLLLVDGNTMNEGVWGTAPLGTEFTVSLASIERIEVVRGPGSALYGPGAMFAVVNVITKTGTGIDGLEAAVQGGSYGQRRGTVLFGRRLRSGTAVMFSGLIEGKDGQDHYYPEFDTPETNHGVAHNLDWERRWGVVGGVAHGDLALHARYGVRTKAIPTGEYGADFNVPDTYYRDTHGAVQLEYNRDLAAAYHLSARSYVDVFQLKGQASYGGAQSPITAHSTQVGAEAALRWDFHSSSRLTVGAEVRESYHGDYVSGEHRQETLASLYLQEEYQISGRLTALGGLRFDDQRTSDNALSPRAALIYAPSHRTTLKALYGEALRAPSTLEAGAGADNAVDPEGVKTFELLWQQRFSRGYLSTMSVYQYQAHGLIEATGDNLTSYANTGEADAVGVEMGIQARPGQYLAWYGGYAYQDARADNSETRLTNSPVHQLKGGVSVQTLPWLRPAVEFRYESPRRTVIDTETDSYLLTNAHLLITPREDDRVALSIRLNNAFNTRYALPGGTNDRQAAIGQDGRNVSVQLRYRH